MRPGKPSMTRKAPGPASRSIGRPTSKAAWGGAATPAWRPVIQMTPGAIGYTETSYAELAKLPIARLQNKEGEFTLPDPENNLASLSGANLQKFFDHVKKTKKEDYYHDRNHRSGRRRQPIRLSRYTWIFVSPKIQGRTNRAMRLKDVLEYCLTEGQKISPEPWVHLAAAGIGGDVCWRRCGKSRSAVNRVLGRR